LPAVTLNVQVPSPLQLSAVQTNPSLQVYAVPPHAPAVHTSFFVQALPSLHAVPSALFGLLHNPALGSQIPTLWHWSLAVQTIPWHLAIIVATAQTPGTWHWLVAPL
jgi:hypothetical protein